VEAIYCSVASGKASQTDLGCVLQAGVANCGRIAHKRGKRGSGVMTFVAGFITGAIAMLVLIVAAVILLGEC